MIQTSFSLFKRASVISINVFILSLLLLLLQCKKKGFYSSAQTVKLDQDFVYLLSENHGLYLFGLNIYMEFSAKSSKFNFVRNLLRGFCASSR